MSVPERARHFRACTDIEPLGVVSGDILHGFGARSGAAVSVDHGDVGTGKSVPDAVRSGAGLRWRQSSPLVRSAPARGIALQVMPCSSR